MNLYDFAMFMLLVFGTVYLIVESAIAAPLRIVLAKRSTWLRALVYCPYCVGFWIGLLYSFSWPWTGLEHGWLGLYPAIAHHLEPAIITMGVIALIRAVWPAFLSGAWEHEREIYEAP